MEDQAETDLINSNIFIRKCKAPGCKAGRFVDIVLVPDWEGWKNVYKIIGLQT
jgi:hypothetical protein